MVLPHSLCGKTALQTSCTTLYNKGIQSSAHGLTCMIRIRLAAVYMSCC